MILVKTNSTEKCWFLKRNRISSGIYTDIIILKKSLTNLCTERRLEDH